MSDLRKEIFLRGWQRNVPLPLLLLTWSYFNRVRIRFLAVVARVRAGKLPAPREPRASCADGSAPVKAREPWPLRRVYGWLVKLVGPQPRYCATRLHYMLHDPDMKALLAASPQLCRLLRTIFWALKERPAPDLLPPRPRRTRQAIPRPEAVAAATPAPAPDGASRDAIAADGAAICAGCAASVPGPLASGTPRRHPDIDFSRSGRRSHKHDRFIAIS